MHHYRLLITVPVCVALIALGTVYGDESLRPLPPADKQKPQAERQKAQEVGRPPARSTDTSRVNEPPRPAPSLSKTTSPDASPRRSTGPGSDLPDHPPPLPRPGKPPLPNPGSDRPPGKRIPGDWPHVSPAPSTHKLPDMPNSRQPSPASPTWAVFMGTGWNEKKKGLIDQWQRDGKWVNPFTGQPLKDAQVFVFGRDNALLEAVRIVGDHFEMHPLSSREELRGQHFDFVMCHSNGCPNAIDAQRQGLIQVDTFFALGTDWTSKGFQPGDLRGANLVFFTMKTDPIWKIPAPNWARLEDGVALKFSIPFDSPTEIPKGAWNLLTQGRADPDRFPVVRLDPPPGERSTPLQPFKAHGLAESYFPAINQWRQSDGPQQKIVHNILRQVDAAPSQDDWKKSLGVPPGCPGCGGGNGSNSLGNLLQGPNNGISSKIISPDPRGGVSADVHINPGDFQAR